MSAKSILEADGKAILTGSRDRTVRIWDATTGHPIGPPFRHDADVWSVAFAPDGRSILTGDVSGTVRAFILPPDLPDDPGPDDGPESRSGSDSARSAAVLAPPTPEEEREMLAAAAVPVAPGDRQDPDEVALALLREQFGAKSLDG